MDRRIFFPQFYRVLSNDGQVVVGEFLDNEKWMSFDENDLEHNVKSLSIDLTSDCDLKYKHGSTCYSDNTDIDMSKELLENIIKWAEEHGVESITLMAEGRYLLPNMNELLMMVKQNFSGCIDIITDGTLL